MNQIWIKSSEMLPEPHVVVLSYSPGIFAFAHYSKENGWHSWSTKEDHCNITHWVPLIAPNISNSALIDNTDSVPYGIDPKTGKEWESWREWYEQHPEALK